MTWCSFFAMIGVAVTVLAAIFVLLVLSQLTLDDNMKPYKPWWRF